MKKNDTHSETNSPANAHRSRSITVSVLMLFVVLLSTVSGIYAGASLFAQQAPNVTVTTTIYATTTSWTTSTMWSTVTEVVQGVLTTVQYTTSTSTITATAAPAPTVITIGGTSGFTAYAGSYAVASPITMPSAGTVTSIGVNFATRQSGNVRVALYSAGSGKPASLLTQSASTALSASGWLDIPVTAYSVASGSYWVAFNFDRNLYVYYSPGSRCYYYKPFGNFDPTWSGSYRQDSSYQANVRVTYTTVLAFLIGGSPIMQTITSSLVSSRGPRASSQW